MIWNIGYGKGSVFFITGGKHSSSTEVLDLNDSNSSCSRNTEWLPGNGRSGHSINTLNDGRVIVCGGGYKRSRYPTSCDTTMSPMGPWTTYHSQLTAPRKSHSSVTSGGKVHLIGGYAEQTAETLDMDGNVWIQRGPIPYTVDGGSCAVKINDSAIFVTGGSDGWKGNRKSAMWNPELDQWTLMADMDSRRRYHGCGVLTRQGRIYVLVAGGQFERSSSLYDVSTNTWTRAGDMSHVRSGGQMLDGELMAGGWTGNYEGDVHDTIERFDFETRQWSNTQIKMKSARTFFAAVAVDRTTFC